MPVRKINNRWHVDVRFNGKRIRKVSPENTKASALICEREVLDELAMQATSHIEGTSQAKYSSYGAFALDWLETYVKANNRPSEQKKKSGILANHLLPYFGEHTIDSVVEREIEALKRDMSGKGYAPKTINNVLSVLRKSLDCAVQWGLLKHTPKFTWLRVPKKEITVVSKEAQALLLADNSYPLWNALIVTALKTGMRIGEILALRWKDIDFESNTINVNGSINVEYERAATKNGKTRTIPMSYELRDRLHNLMSPAAKMTELYIFARDDGKPYSVYAVSDALKKVAKNLGITEHLHWHKFRHTFASNIAMAGVNMRILQELMGHATILMTERYSHVDMESKHSAIQLLDYTNENFGPIVGRLQNLPTAQKAKHNHEMAVLSRKVTGIEESYS